MAGIQDEINKDIKKYLDASIQGMLREYESSGIKNTGSLGQSLTSLVQDNNGRFTGSIGGNDYVHQLIHGREPGTMPPLDQIKAWVETKGIGDGDNTDSIAYAIALKIKNEGITVPNRFNDGQLLSGIEDVNVLYTEVNKNILKSFITQMKNIFK